MTPLPNISTLEINELLEILRDIESYELPDTVDNAFNLSVYGGDHGKAIDALVRNEISSRPADVVIEELHAGSLDDMISSAMEA